jgi:hypothetical protein
MNEKKKVNGTTLRGVEIEMQQKDKKNKRKNRGRRPRCHVPDAQHVDKNNKTTARTHSTRLSLTLSLLLLSLIEI